MDKHTPTQEICHFRDGSYMIDGKSFSQPEIVSALNSREELLKACKLLLDAVDIPSLTKADIKFVGEAIAKAEAQS